MIPTPPASEMVSVKEIQVASLKVSLMGVDELPNDSSRPLVVLCMMHGRLSSSAEMEPTGHRLVRASLQNPDRRSDLLLVNFDLPNHGARCVEPRRNLTWEYGNATHSEDMWLQIRLAVKELSFLTSVLPITSEWPEGRVDITWGTYGESMGAHIGFICASLEPSVSLCVSLMGTPNLSILGESRAIAAGTYFSEQLFQDMVKHSATNNMARLREVDILMLHGEDDELVPWTINDSIVHDLATTGKTSYKLYPGIAHAVTEEMVHDSAEWLVKRLQ